MTGFTMSAWLRRAVRGDPQGNWNGLAIARQAGVSAGRPGPRRRVLVALAIVLAAILVSTEFGRAVTEDLAPDQEQLTLGTSSGFANLLLDDAANWVGTEGAVGGNTANYYPGSSTKVKGILFSGTEPTCWEDSEDTRCIYQEADQAVPSDLVPDVETIDKGTAVSGSFPGDIDDDNGVSRVYREADQAPAAYQATLYPNADGYTNAWVTAGTPACDTTTPWYDEVDEGAAPDGDTTCRQAASNGQIIAVGMQDAAITGTPSDVDVCARGYFEDDVSGANSIRILIRSGATNSFSGAYNPPAPGAGYSPPSGWYCLDTDPADAADWTDADVDAIQIGADTPDANPDPRVTQFEMIVWANYSLDYELQVTYDHTGPESCTGTRTLTINAWRASGATMENVEVYMATSAEAFSNLAFTVSATADGTTYTHVLTDDEWDLGLPNYRSIDTTTSGDTSQGDLDVDYAVIQCVTSDFELAVDFDFDLPTTTGTEFRLFVEGRQGVGNPEQMDVAVYGSNEVTLFGVVCSITSTTEAEYDCGTLTADQLDGGDVDIRMVDVTQSGDTAQSTVEIDRIRVQRTFDRYELEEYHEWVTSVAAADAYELRVRALRSDTEDCLVQLATWPGLTWNTRITVSSGTETLYTYTPLAAERASNGTVMSRWLGSLETGADETQSTCTADQEIVRRTDNAPSLSGAYHIPASPTDAQTVTFRVNYTDTLTCPATVVNVAVDGAPDQAMNEYDPGDTDCSDVKIYTYTLGPYSVGPHTYFFNASDGANPAVAIGPYSFTVTSGNAPPTLTDPGHEPASPDDTETIDFNVTYTDSDPADCPPSTIQAFINGAALGQDMTEADPLDLDCTDGKLYTLNDGPFEAGAHTYRFEASDGTDTASSGPWPFTVTASGGPGFRFDCDGDGIPETNDACGGFFNPSRTTFTWELVNPLGGCRFRFIFLGESIYPVLRIRWTFPDGTVVAGNLAEARVVEHEFLQGCGLGGWLPGAWAVKMEFWDGVDARREIAYQVTLNRWFALVAGVGLGIMYMMPDEVVKTRAWKRIKRYYRREIA
jgi:hypothetical protein